MNFWSSNASARRIVVGFFIAVLLGLYGLEVALSARDLSATWDEPYHIIAGYYYWHASDYGINPEHPPLAKLVGTFPLLFMHLNVPRIGRDNSKDNAIKRGREFVYGNDADAILLRARLAESAMGLILVLLLFEAGYRMFGLGAGWMAAVLAIFEPNLLAHATLVTTDFALACFCFATIYALWRVAQQSTPLRVAGCGVMCGLALASKHSAILIVPILALLAAVEIALRVVKLRPQGTPTRQIVGREIRLWAGRLAIIYGVAALILWAFYGFRYIARPDMLPLWQDLPVADYASLVQGHIAPWLVSTAGRWKLLPESYLFGLVDVLIVTTGPRLSFILGHLYSHAVWFYFPVALIIKSTVGFLLLLVLALAAIKLWSGESHRRAAYLLIPPAIFMAVAMNAGTNMGIRHVLPIYPFLILAAAAGAGALASRHRGWAGVVALLLLFHVASSLHSLPNYLAYSNELFGGTSRTYAALSDSNSDWGQGLREAGEYLRRRNIKDCWLAYFGTALPTYYHLPCKMLPDPFLRWWNDPIMVPPETYDGVVLISGTEIAAPYWGPYPLNPYIGFLHKKPADTIGGSILVFEGQVDLRQASAFGHMYKTWDYIKADQPEAATQEALKAEELAPDHPAPPFLLGYILAHAKRTEAARIQFEASLKLAQAGHPEFESLWITAAKDQLAILPKPGVPSQ